MHCPRERLVWWLPTVQICHYKHFHGAEIAFLSLFDVSISGYHQSEQYIIIEQFFQPYISSIWKLKCQIWCANQYYSSNHLIVQFVIDFTLSPPLIICTYICKRQWVEEKQPIIQETPQKRKKAYYTLMWK